MVIATICLALSLTQTEILCAPKIHMSNEALPSNVIAFGGGDFGRLLDFDVVMRVGSPWRT